MWESRCALLVFLWVQTKAQLSEKMLDYLKGSDLDATRAVMLAALWAYLLGILTAKQTGNSLENR